VVIRPGRYSVRLLTADLFVTLDGFAMGEGAGPFFGYGGPELHRWIRDRLDKPQLIVMGRVTYEALAGMSATATDESSARMNELPKVVFSNSLREPLAWANTRLVRGDLREGLRALKQQPGDPLRSIGSISLVKSMIALGLVERLRLMVFPLILGRSGREPAFAGYPDTALDLVASAVLDSRLTLLEYRPVPAAG
jgi:dihydrofolate reductase